MKVRFLIFVLLFFIIFSIHLGAQNLNLPPPVDLLQYVNDRVFGFVGENSLLVRARIWGWSRDGKVAYSIERESDQIYISFYVFDFINDNILFEMDIVSNNILNFTTAYNTRKDEITGAVLQYNIIEQQTDFLPFPIKNNNVSYDGEIVWGKGYRPPEFFNEEAGEWGGMEFDDIYDVSIIIKRNGQVKKTIKTYNGILPGGFGYLIELCGYFLSPFENRALIVIALAQYDVHYDFSGCHLDIGFH